MMKDVPSEQVNFYWKISMNSRANEAIQFAFDQIPWEIDVFRGSKFGLT